MERSKVYNSENINSNNNNNHHISPFLMGHSFGGATVLHLMADESMEAIKFRKLFPIAGSVIHDPLTVIPLIKSKTCQTYHLPFRH